MKKIIILFWLLGTGMILNGQRRNFSPDDSFTRQYFKRHYNYSSEVRLFDRSWNRLISTYLLTTTFSNRLSSIASFDLPTNDPEVLLSDYYNKINQLNVSFVQQQEVNNAMIDQGIRGLGELAAGYARDNNLTTNNTWADFFIKEIAIGTVQERAKQKNAEKLELQRSELQATLESNLSTEMSTIRDQMLSENIELRDKYLEAMVYEADYSKEKYYASCYDYYNCFSEQIKSDYAYNSSSWYKPNCRNPGENYSTAISESDYINIAFRKLNLYRKYSNEKFIDGINIFLDAGLSQNKQNPKAYFLKAQLTSDMIDKLFYTYLAFDLDPENTENERELKTIITAFNDDFFLAIRNEDVDFISRSIEKGFHLGREKNGRSAIETAIDFDKVNILEMLINSTLEENNILSENGSSLLFHACAVDALEVTKTLISLGVNPEFADKNYSGLTALNIAERNNSQKVLFYLASNFSIKQALLFALNSGADDLESFSIAIFNAVPAKLDDISSVNPSFRTKYFSDILIRTNYDDAEIFINNEKVGSGKVEIPNSFINKKYAIKIRKPGYSTEEKDLELQSGNDLVLDVRLQETPKPLLKYYTSKDLGFEERNWNFYYKEPYDLKKESRKNKEYNLSLRENAKSDAMDSLRIYNEKISRELEKRNSVISENNRKISEENRILESDRLADLQYLKRESVSQPESVSKNSVEKNNPALYSAENSNPGIRNGASDLAKDQKSDYLENDPVNTISTGNRIVEKPSNMTDIENRIIELMGDDILISDTRPTKRDGVRFQYFNLNDDGIDEIIVWNFSMAGAQNCLVEIWQANPLKKLTEGEYWGVFNYLKPLNFRVSDYRDIELNYYVSGEAVDPERKHKPMILRWSPEKNLYIVYQNGFEKNIGGLNTDTSNDSDTNTGMDTGWTANYNDAVELAKEVIKRSDIFWNPTTYYTTLTYYSVGRIATMYGGGYILLESPKLAFEMVTGGFYGFTKSVTKDWILDIIERSVKTPGVICKEISETTMEQGISDYKIAYEIAARYKKTNILSREDAFSFLDHRWGVNRLPIGRVLYNETIAQKYSVSNEAKEKAVEELTDSFETSYKKTHSMTQTVSFTDAAFFIKDIGEIMEQKKLGLMNYQPYLNFEKKIANLNQNRINEAKKFGVIP